MSTSPIRMPHIRILATGDSVTVSSSVGDTPSRKYTADRFDVYTGALNVLGAIARADNYVRLPRGLYRAEHTEWVSRRSGKRAPSIVFTECLYSYGEVLTSKQAQELNQRDIHIHPANYPFELEGCWAVGLYNLPMGVGQSRDATMLLIHTTPAQLLIQVGKVGDAVLVLGADDNILHVDSNH